MLSEVSSANGTTVYTYDVNGSLTNKSNEGKFSYQYGYDLRNRLATASITRKEGTADVTITSSYAYNADGIRTRALQTINGNTQNRYFLLDDGHTGYTQVFEETAELGGSIVRSYTIGDDVLSQTVAGVTSHLLYDGHGSTRQVVDSDGGVTANYAYDAYGKMLGGNPGVTDGKQSITDLLYAGEQFDPGLQMEYLRARYYDQDNGRFNRLDPFEGNGEDPLSLHKYVYTHCDPINGIDPSGEFTLLNLLCTVAIITTTVTLLMPSATKVYHSANRIMILNDISIALQSSDLSAEEQLYLRQAILQEFFRNFSSVAEGVTELVIDIAQSAVLAGVGGGLIKLVGKGIKAGRVLVGAKFAQKTINATGRFSDFGIKKYSKLAGRQINTVDDLALALKQGVVKAKDLPIDYIVRDGNTLIINTRTAVALERAGIPRTAWYAIDQTGNSAIELSLIHI